MSLAVAQRSEAPRTANERASRKAPTSVRSSTAVGAAAVSVMRGTVGGSRGGGADERAEPGELVVFGGNRVDDGRGEQVLLEQHEREAVDERIGGAAPRRRLEQRTAPAELREPLDRRAPADELVEPRLLGVDGRALPRGRRQRGDQPGRQALHLGGQEEPPLGPLAAGAERRRMGVRHASSMPGTASRSMSWKFATAFSFAFSTPRS